MDAAPLMARGSAHYATRGDRLDHVADALPGLVEMARQDLGEARGVARLERGDHRLVLVDRGLPLDRALVADEADALEARLDRLVAARQEVVVGQARDRAVDRLVALVVVEP